MIHPKLSPTQQQAMWAVYRASVLTTMNQWEFVEDDGRVRAQTMSGLHHKRLITMERLPELRVRERERVYSSVVQWRAELTHAGQEWIAREMLEAEGLTTRDSRSTV